MGKKLEIKKASRYREALVRMTGTCLPEARQAGLTFTTLHKYKDNKKALHF